MLPMQTCRSKCLEDLQSTTRYVTWSLHTKSRSSLKAMLSKVGPQTAGRSDVAGSRQQVYSQQ